MLVLALNCGSATLKFDVLDVDVRGDAAVAPASLASGLVERIGGDSTLAVREAAGPARGGPCRAPDHGAAAALVLERLEGMGIGSFGVTGHRVVHGGERFKDPVRVDEDVLRDLDALSDLAPLHNAPALGALREARRRLGEDVPAVAVFDTAFHARMPPRASRYALPAELVERHRIRRYGFHGLAHRWMWERWSALAGAGNGTPRAVSLQLGNGCSAAAVAGGRSVDTSMGFTPAEGLVMGTRCGDLDPTLGGWLARREGADASEVEEWLVRRSGLLGVSGRSRDMRDLLDAEAAGDARSGLAVEIFCYRARKYLGAYMAALGGADAVLFGGGIGENSPEVRARICEGMEWGGLVLDPGANAAARGAEARVSREGSRVEVWVLPVNEAALIARDAVRCLTRGRSVGGDEHEAG